MADDRVPALGTRRGQPQLAEQTTDVEGEHIGELTGGATIAWMLAAEGVECIFGIIDGTYYGLYASLADAGITLISPRHETSAAHMAGAYARTTGRLGVVMASNGPGVANVLPGVAVEQGEGNRVLPVTSARRTGIGSPDRGGAPTRRTVRCRVRRTGQHRHHPVGRSRGRGSRQRRSHAPWLPLVLPRPLRRLGDERYATESSGVETLACSIGGPSIAYPIPRVP